MKPKKNQTIGGLGRGLEELFSPTKIEEENDENSIKIIHIQSLKAGIHQPRKSFSNESLEELAISIKNQGIIQPLLVREIENDENNKIQYEIIAGERRFRAAQKAQIEEIPVIIREYSDEQSMTIALIENLQREDLNVIEEAEAYQKLKDIYKFSQEELAETLGKSRPAVANALRLLSLPEIMKNSIIKGEIKASHGRSLLAISDEKAQNILFEAIIKQELNAREIEKAVEEWKNTGLLPHFINKEDEFSEINHTKKEKIQEEKTELIKNIDQKLKDKFYKKALIRGNERKGSIKINYKSFEELQYILDTLNIEYKI